MEVAFAQVQDVQQSIDAPTYRVYFWKGSTSYEYELTGCRNVREAFAWADENAGADRTYTLYAVADVGERRGLIRLFGIDPTRHLGHGRKADWPGQVYDED